MEIKVVRSRRKTLCLQIERSGEVVARAPYGVPKATIDAFVKKHEDWLKRKLSERSAREFDLSDGAKLLLFGREAMIASGRARYENGTLYLPKENRERALVSLLKRLAYFRMEKLTRETAERFSLVYGNIKITSARGRWGSCSAKGNISYTFRTAFLPDELASYLAAHELAHTVHHDHSAAFWAETAKMIPNTKFYRKELKKYGWAMNIL